VLWFTASLPHRFDHFAAMAENGRCDENYLRAVAERDSLFPDMDYRVFQARPVL